MYKIYCDKKLIYDPRIKDLALQDLSVSLEISNAGSFSFTIPTVHPFYDSITKMKSYLEVFKDDELIFCGRPVEESIDFYKNKNIFCEGELAFLNDSIQRPSENHGVTVRQFMENIIDNHNNQVEEEKWFRVGVVTVTDPNDSLYKYTNYENTLKVINDKLIKSLGGYLFVRHEDGERYIDYLAELPDTTTQKIEFGRNLLDFASNIDATDIATRIIPLGAKLEESSFTSIDERLTIAAINGGLDYVESAEAVETYGILTKVKTWDSVTTAENLKRKGQEYLESVQWENMTIEVSAIDLHDLKADIESINIGDKILVVSSPHGLNKYFPVSKFEINLLDPTNNRITLGSKMDVSITTKSNTTETTANNASTFSASSVLNSAKENASNLIKMATNGFIVMKNDEKGNPEELLIMDTDNIDTATKVWRWNVNGLGYSSTGYDGNYDLAITMDGSIVADSIRTGTLSTDRLSGKITADSDVEITWGAVAGGRNMLPNTEKMDEHWASHRATHTFGFPDPDGGNKANRIQGTSSVDSYWAIEDMPIFTQQGKYILTFWAKASKDFQLAVIGGDNITHMRNLTTEWAKYSVEYNINEAITKSGFYFGGWYTWKDTEVLVDIYHPMLEPGEVASEWTEEVRNEDALVDITRITKDTITAPYIEAMNIKAGSVDAENITGTKISGKVLDGSTIVSDSQYYKTTQSGGKYTIIRKDNEKVVFEIKDGGLVIYPRGSSSLVDNISFIDGEITLTRTDGKKLCLNSLGFVVYDNNYAAQAYVYSDGKAKFGDLTLDTINAQFTNGNVGGGKATWVYSSALGKYVLTYS